MVLDKLSHRVSSWLQDCKETIAQQPSSRPAPALLTPDDIDKDFSTCHDSSSTYSILSELEKLSCSSCPDWECTAKSVSTTSTTTGSNEYYFSLSREVQTALLQFEDDSDVLGTAVSGADASTFVQTAPDSPFSVSRDVETKNNGNSTCVLKPTHVPNVGRYYDNQGFPFPHTVESLIHVSRNMDVVPSFYQLPELNTEPVDFCPRYDYVSSQYVKDEMYEYQVHNTPTGACKLKTELQISNNAASNQRGSKVSSHSIHSEYCLPDMH
ncbi:hypothetical protein DdX_07980 [Ditylenchus destructor]|uniref:Uncharacterized protein n=1 Tax=Ditylenchus destructor TaxID=166010 RepID=A0AAD4R4Q8_9BILA|nr:hypothetical protein DdX_07980 [Ditylenchus destructor]